MKVKTTRTLSKVFTALLLFLLVSAVQTLRAQTYLEELRNDVAVSPTVYEFDIYVLQTGTTPLEIAAIQHGIYINSAIIPSGATITASIVANSSEFVALQQPAAANISIANSSPNKTIKITGAGYPGAGAGTMISSSGFGTRYARIRVTCSAPFVANSHANLAWSFASPPSWPSKIQAYVGGVPLNITTNASHTVNNLLNPALNAPTGNPPAAFSMTGGGDYCSNTTGAPVGLSGSELGVTYTLTPGGATAVGTGLAVSFGPQPTGTYTASGTANGTVSTIVGTTAMTGTAVVNTATPANTVESTVSACDSYTWALNGVTYTTGGDKTFVDGCVTNILHLTITPSSTVEFTAAACDSYTWALNGVTYTTGGDKTFVDGCVTNILHLTITPSSTVEFTVSATGSYTWPLNGVTYTTSGDYTYVVGCVTNVLHLTINVAPCLATTWTGAAHTEDWGTLGNWSDCVPQAGTVVTIPHLSDPNPSYPRLLAPASCASITIESGASFIGSEFLTTGNAVVKQEFPLTGYHYLSAPVANNTFNTVFPMNQNAVWAYLYDEPTGNWLNQTIANSLGEGVGYSVRMDVPQTAMFAGQLFANPVQKNLSLGNTSGIAYRAGWNLYGNPFTSAIDWDQVTLLGADAAVYVWNGSVYKAYVHGGTGDPGFEDGLIPAMNGFFVHSATPGASIIVGLQARTNLPKAFFKESASNVLSLRADANTYSDGAVVSFNDNATTGFDAQYDAYKLTGIEQAPKLYSMVSGDILSINSLPMQGNEVVNLGFKCGVNGTYSINANGMASFDATTPILLEDLKTGTIQDLRVSPSYSFDYTTTDNENRFKLHFKSANGITPNSLSGINIYSAVSTVVINNTTKLAGEVKIYDLAGRELMHTSMSSQNETRIPVNFAVGTYMVKVITENGVASNKVFIR